MNTSQFMDEQILGLSAPASGGDFIDLGGSPEEESHRNSGGGGDVKKEDILPNYDFHPIRPIGSPPSSAHGSLDASRPSRGSVDSKTATSNLKYAGILEAQEFAKVHQQKERAAHDSAMVADIDRTFKKYADSLMHALEGVSSRLSQLESRTHHLEISVDDLKTAIENNNDSSDRKLMQLENIVRAHWCATFGSTTPYLQAMTIRILNLTCSSSGCERNWSTFEGVQTGVQVFRDKQEIAETRLQLAKLQPSKEDQKPPENFNTGQLDSRQQIPSHQSVQPLHPSGSPAQPSSLPVPTAPPPQQSQPSVQYPGQLPSLSAQPAQNAPPPSQQNQPSVQYSGQLPSLPGPPALNPPPPQQNQPSVQYYGQLPSLPGPPAPNVPPPPQPNQPSVQYPGQLPQPQIPGMPSYFGQPAQSTDTDTAQQQYQMSSQQQQPPQQQTYQTSPQLPQFSQTPQAPQPVNPSQLQPPLFQHPEDSAQYATAPQNYPPNIRQSSPMTLPSGPHQLYGPNPSMYEPHTNRPNSGQLSFPGGGYGPPTGTPPSYSEPYPYSGSPSHYNSSGMKPSPFSSSTATSGGSNSYQRLPTAQILPQSQPAGSSGGSTGNRMPVDDVIDKVATMGFSRDQVRATVRKLTENGQSVDLNVVLDKLMNGGEIQPQKGWFGR